MSIGKKKVVVGNKTYVYPRNYVSEYSERSEAQKKNRSKRRRARNLIIKKRGKKVVDGKDVHHVHGMSSNKVRVVSSHYNRSIK